MSKVFDKVCYKCLMHKLKQNDNILNTAADFLTSRKQWVVLKGQVSQWASIEAASRGASRVHTRTTIISDLYE